MLPLLLIAVAPPGSISPGHFGLPVFGSFAAAGIIAALWLSQRTARFMLLAPHRLWDAGVLAVLSAFLVSRLLLVALNFRLFRAEPMLVLAQPSLTYGGLAITAGLVWLWLTVQRLPLLPVLDAWAAPAALLAAILQLGHFAEGTDAGLPTRLPWGVHSRGDVILGRVQPVQLYTAAAELALCALLLSRMRRPEPRGFAGEFGSQALFLGGLISFLLGFFRQPYDTYGKDWLDPAQAVALAGMLLGAVLWLALRPQLSSPSTG